MGDVSKESEDMFAGHVAKPHLTMEEVNKMKIQNTRLVPEFQALQLEKDTKKHWDLFYKRNENRFFKDRHWTTREFEELGIDKEKKSKRLLEVGCGVGNLIYPLLECNINIDMIYACDLSPRAIKFVKSNKLYNPKKIIVFQTDITMENCFNEINSKIDIAMLVFVLSAIHPNNFKSVIRNLYSILDKNGILLFRDYGQYDMTQLRFKAGHKISENFYMRQDGTRTYFFTVEEIQNLFEDVGFKTITCSYVQRRTINLKEHIDVPRIFIQAKFMKP